MKISKTLERRLDCICGLCSHDYTSKSCLFYKIADTKKPEETLKKEIIKWMQDVEKTNKVKKK